MKVWNYVFTAITMMLFFEFLGYPTTMNVLFNFFNIVFNSTGGLQSFSLDTSSFFSYLFAGVKDFFTSTDGLLTSLVGGGITLGLYYSGKPDIAIKAGFAGAIFVSFASALYFPLKEAITMQLAPWAIGILAMIFIPYTIAFLFALVEYIVGGTSD